MIDYTRAFIVTCPECGTKTVAYWRDSVFIGGVDSADCPKCGNIIMSESDGDPVDITDELLRGAV